MIFRNIYLNKSFLVFLLIIILTGNFNYFVPYFILLFVHEMFHAIMGLIFGYQIKKIMFYPLGGVTIFNFPFNISLKKEFLILIAGPIGQVISYLILRNYFPFISPYHYTLLIFNMLPIYPLDGGKILNIFCNYFHNYLMSIKITFIVSLIMIISLILYNVYHFNLNLFFMTIIILIKLVLMYRKRFFYYNRFLLERYLNDYHFQKIKHINNLNSFYRDCLHYVNYNYEKNVLKAHFELK